MGDRSKEWPTNSSPPNKNINKMKNKKIIRVYPSIFYQSIMTEVISTSQGKNAEEQE
jgi:hypothetical protein